MHSEHALHLLFVLFVVELCGHDMLVQLMLPCFFSRVRAPPARSLSFLINTLHFTSKMIYVVSLLFACLSSGNTNYQIRYFSWKQNAAMVAQYLFKIIITFSFDVHTRFVFLLTKLKTMINQSKNANLENYSNSDLIGKYSIRIYWNKIESLFLSSFSLLPSISLQNKEKSRSEVSKRRKSKENDEKSRLFS